MCVTEYALHKRLNILHMKDLSHSQWRICYAIAGKLSKARQAKSVAIRNEWLVDAMVAIDNLEVSVL